MVAAEGEGQEVGDFVKAHKLYGQIVTPGEEEARVGGPRDADDVVAVEVAVFFV